MRPDRVLSVLAVLGLALATGVLLAIPAGADETTTEPPTPSPTSSPTPTSSTAVDVDDAVLRWGVNNESNNRAFAPGTYNFFSAGRIPDPGRGGATIPASSWRQAAGAVEIEKWTGSSYVDATWAGLSTDSAGAPLGSATSGTFSNHQIVFGGGTGTVDRTAGTARIAWAGEVTVLAYSGMSFFYLADPVLEVADGRGTVTATMQGYTSSRADATVWELLAPATVTLAVLPAVDLAELGFVAQPAYLGVTVTGVPQHTTGASAGAFPQSFVDYADRLGTAAFWYSSNAATDAYKVPLPLSVSYDRDATVGQPTPTQPTSTPQPVAPPTVKPPPMPTASPTASATPATPTPTAAGTGSAAQPVPSAAALPSAPTPPDGAAVAPAAALPAATQLFAAAPVAAPLVDPTPSARLWWAGGVLLVAAALVLLLPVRPPAPAVNPTQPASPEKGTPLSTTSHRLGRLAAVGLAGALSIGTLVGVGAAPAGAATSESTLAWGFSQYLNEHLLGQTFTGGASEDAAGVVTFGGGTGRRDTGTGVTTSQYAGSARYAFVNGGSEFYSVTFTDPAVTVAADGAGEIVADIAWTAPGNNGSAQDVTLTTFDATPSSWTGFDLAATPDWAGVVEVGAEPYGAGKPVNGETWAPEFVSTLPSSVRATFYSSGSNPTSDAKKDPAPFVAQVPGPRTQVADSTVTADEVAFAVTGSGFSAATNPGDAGVYVGLAPSGGLPDTSSQSNLSTFAAAAWIMPAQITDGSFSANLDADLSKLIAGTSYSIYTWQAHAHSNTTQDTEQPVVIDWAALGAQTVGPRITVPATTYGSASTVRVQVPNATGTVMLSGAGADQRATLTDGTASFALPAGLPATRLALKAAYSGDVKHYPSTGTSTFDYTRATPGLTATWKKKPTAKRAGRLAVDLAGVAGVAAPTGRVVVTLKGAGKTTKVTGTLAGGAVVLPVTRLKAGRWKATVSYAGDGGYATAVDQVSVKVAKTKKNKKK